jgi:hypothetical protein
VIEEEGFSSFCPRNDNLVGVSDVDPIRAQLKMMWSGLVVVLIVPAAFVMICVVVLLHRSGVIAACRGAIDKFKRRS